MINYRISITAGIFLVIAAIIADLISLIPFVGTVSGPLFWIIVSWYLWKKGCGLFNPRRFATEIISSVIEIIPAIQALPAATAGIIAVIVMIRLEDRTGISVKPDLNVSIRKPRYTSDQNGKGVRMPEQNNSNIPPKLNTNGIRLPNGGLK